MKARMAAALLLLLIAFPGWSQAPDPRPVILAFGDSMTAGYGVPGGYELSRTASKNIGRTRIQVPGREHGCHGRHNARRVLGE